MVAATNNTATPRIILNGKGGVAFDLGALSISVFCPSDCLFVAFVSRRKQVDHSGNSELENSSHRRWFWSRVVVQDCVSGVSRLRGRQQEFIVVSQGGEFMRGRAFRDSTSCVSPSLKETRFSNHTASPPPPSLSALHQLIPAFFIIDGMQLCRPHGRAELSRKSEE